jgi:hypothetical protein
VDDHRFDNLVRSMAGSGTRRRILRGLAGVGALLAAGRHVPAAAHHGTLGPGDPCRNDSQCVAADAPLICADNGFAYDGPLNCCTLPGSRCATDEGCCWDNVCVAGVCGTVGDFPGPGARCTADSVCVAADTAVNCDYNAKTDDFRCCAYEGSRCGSDAGCCGWLRCDDAGFCTGLPPSGCDGEGCDCDFHDPSACAAGLVCCAVQSGFICATREDCGGG